MGGGKGGGGDSDKYSRTAGQIAEALFTQTDPNRQQLLSGQSRFLEGDPDYESPVYAAARNKIGPDYDVAQNPAWQIGRPAIESQYDVARQNVIGASPRGGALGDRLQNVESMRARSLGDLAGTVGQDEYNKAFSASQDEYNKAYGTAFGAPQQAMGTYTTLAGNEAMASAQEQSGKYGALGGMGQGLGMYLGSK